MDTDIEKDPQQEKAERIKKLRAHVELLDRPALFNAEAWKAADTDLRLFLKEEFERHDTDPKAFPSNNWYRENADSSDEACEVDANAIVSRGVDENGAYVQAWTWVPGPSCSNCGEAVPPGENNNLCPECKELEEEDDD